MTPTDPLIGLQWHLINTTAGQFDLNVREAWTPSAGGRGYSGSGVRTAVIDDGFDYTHRDLSTYQVLGSVDLANGTVGAFGYSWNWHGTSVAGIIGAAANGYGTVGVAYETTLVGYRIAMGLSSTFLQQWADAIRRAAVGSDLVNTSLGLSNDARSEFGIGYQRTDLDGVSAAIDHATQVGRGGLGMSVIKSAGNARAEHFDVNADGAGNNSRAIIVAAVDRDGFVSSYSSFGAALLVSGFGTPGDVFAIDRVGRAGYSRDDVNPEFNGTSAAAPMVAGVVALMYEAAPGLGWRDVQSILAASARHVGSEIGGPAAGNEAFGWTLNGARSWNGGGMHFSNDYGYGLVDARAAVRMAESWLLTGTAAQTTANETRAELDLVSGPTQIPDGDLSGLVFRGAVGGTDLVERVTVELSFSTTWIGDLWLEVISPSGTVSRLIRDTDQDSGVAGFSGTWTFHSQAFRDEDAAGTWSVRVIDSAGADILVVTDLILRVMGRAGIGDRYVFTDEVARRGGGTTPLLVADTDGGRDTVNAAAVTGDQVIRLDGVAGSIAGVAVRFRKIENAIGGDGHDLLVGSGAANALYGMRGNDTLQGGAGADTLVGGVGNDTYVVTSALSTVIERAGEGTDLVRSTVTHRLAANVENLTLTGTGNVNAFGTAGDNVLTGNAGNNRLAGGGGRDTMSGGAGNDVYVTDGKDVIIERAGGGIDLVLSSANHRLAANVENLTLTGTGHLRGTGNAEANLITGNGGNNRLAGGLGSDTLTGGAGADVFVFDTAIGPGQADVLTDFRVGQDMIHLDDAIFRALAPGALPGTAFAANDTGLATSAATRLVYERGTGALYYDPDGSGAAERVLVATLTANLGLTASSFFVF